MLRDITHWCVNSDVKEYGISLPPSLLTILLDGENDSADKFVKSVKKKLDKTPRNLDVLFDAPPFPFDHTEFEDPFCLVEDVSDEAVDLEGLENLKESDLEAKLSEIYARFTSVGDGKVKVKKRELLEYVGRRYFIEMSKGESFKGKKGSKKKRAPGSFKRGIPGDIYIPGTVQRSVLRRKIVAGSAFIEEEDIVNYRKEPNERSEVLVAIDGSRSMEQGNKLRSAKKTALSFYYYKSHYFEEAKVDFIIFSDTIKKIKAIDILTEQPHGMTHTAELFHFVFDLYRKSNRSLSEFYLITDGYPQHKKIEETVYHGITIKSAERLSKLNLKTKIILLNTNDEEKNRKNYIYNSMIKDALNGELVRIETDGIAHELYG